jgi:hypothetical protein
MYRRGSNPIILETGCKSAHAARDKPSMLIKPIVFYSKLLHFHWYHTNRQTYNLVSTKNETPMTDTT